MSETIEKKGALWMRERACNIGLNFLCSASRWSHQPHLLANLICPSQHHDRPIFEVFFAKFDFTYDPILRWDVFFPADGSIRKIEFRLYARESTFFKVIHSIGSGKTDLLTSFFNASSPPSNEAGSQSAIKEEKSGEEEGETNGSKSEVNGNEERREEEVDQEVSRKEDKEERNGEEEAANDENVEEGKPSEEEKAYPDEEGETNDPVPNLERRRSSSRKLETGLLKEILDAKPNGKRF